jgi:hypothetical protein
MFLADSYLNNLFQYDMLSGVWTDLSNQNTASGAMPPSPRYDYGFACTESSIYVFGGTDDGKFSCAAID